VRRGKGNATIRLKGKREYENQANNASTDPGASALRMLWLRAFRIEQKTRNHRELILNADIETGFDYDHIFYGTRIASPVRRRAAD
jgi:hypothetical protein